MPTMPGITVFHAGTERRDGKIVAMGGRVLDVTATGKDGEVGKGGLTWR